MKELKELLDELKDYLEVQNELGNRRIALRQNMYEKSDDYSAHNEKRLDKLNRDQKEKIVVSDQPDIFSSGKKETLEQIREDLGECTRCKLHEGRKSIVFGEGNP